MNTAKPVLSVHHTYMSSTATKISLVASVRDYAPASWNKDDAHFIGIEHGTGSVYLYRDDGTEQNFDELWLIELTTA